MDCTYISEVELETTVDVLRQELERLRCAYEEVSILPSYSHGNALPAFPGNPPCFLNDWMVETISLSRVSKHVSQKKLFIDLFQVNRMYYNYA